MLTRGLHTRGRFLPGYLMYLVLSAIALLIYTYLKKKTILNKSAEIYSLLQSTGLSEVLCKFATAQAAHETSAFSSSIFIQNNNAFGMKWAGQINAKGEKSGYANYNSVNNSVADFVAWWTRKRSSLLSLPLYVNSIESYVRFLKNNNYFEDTEENYLKGCKYFYNQIFE